MARYFLATYLLWLVFPRFAKALLNSSKPLLCPSASKFNSQSSLLDYSPRINPLLSFHCLESLLEVSFHMSSIPARFMLQQARLAARQTTLRHASTTSETAQAASHTAQKAKESATDISSKASQGLSRVQSAAGPALSGAAQRVNGALGRIGGRTGRLIAFGRCEWIRS